MKVTRRDSGEVAIFDLEGKILGGSDAVPLLTEIDKIVGEKHPSLLLNLGGVPWLNSSGLGVLLGAFIRMREYGGVLKFMNVRERVDGILVTTRLVELLEVFDDEAEAIKSFGSRPGAETQRS